MEPKRHCNETSPVGTEDMAVPTCQGLAWGVLGREGRWRGGGAGLGENARSHRPSPRHPVPELQETPKTEQETDIIRFAFWKGYSGQKCQEGQRGRKARPEAGRDSEEHEVVQAARTGRGHGLLLHPRRPQASL